VEETDYLEADIDGRLIKGVQLEIPEEDHIPEPTDDMPAQVNTAILRLYVSCVLSPG